MARTTRRVSREWNAASPSASSAPPRQSAPAQVHQLSASEIKLLGTRYIGAMEHETHALLTASPHQQHLCCPTTGGPPRLAGAAPRPPRSRPRLLPPRRPDAADRSTSTTTLVARITTASTFPRQTPALDDTFAAGLAAHDSPSGSRPPRRMTGDDPRSSCCPWPPSMPNLVDLDTHSAIAELADDRPRSDQSRTTSPPTSNNPSAPHGAATHSLAADRKERRSACSATCEVICGPARLLFRGPPLHSATVRPWSCEETSGESSCRRSGRRRAHGR